MIDKRVLVTGSQGFVGSHLMRELQSRSYQTHGLDRQHDINEHAFTMGHSIPGNYFRCDVREYRQLEKILKHITPDFVFHTAAEFGRWNGEDFYENLWSTNVIGTKNILRLQEQLGFRLIFFSSSEIYGDSADLLEEKSLSELHTVPLNDYAISKWVNEMQINNSSVKNDCAILRLFNVYGPGELYSPYRSALCRLIYCCLFDLPFKVFKGHARSYMYIDNAVDSIVNLVSDDTQFGFNQIFNIGSKKEYSIEEVADLVVEVLQCKNASITYSDGEPQTALQKRVSSHNSESLLRLQDSIELAEGIDKTARWLKSYYANIP